MANVENRAAEHGGKIINDVLEHSFNTGNLPCALVILEDTVIAALESPSMENVAYYVGKALTEDSKVILASISKVQLTSGAVQVVYS